MKIVQFEEKFVSQRALLGKWKRKLTEGMNIFANNITAKGLVLKIYFKALITQQ